jgi:hypothetical protein
MLTRDFVAKPALARLAQMVRQLHGNVDGGRK